MFVQEHQHNEIGARVHRFKGRPLVPYRLLVAGSADRVAHLSGVFEADGFETTPVETLGELMLEMTQMVIHGAPRRFSGLVVDVELVEGIDDEALGFFREVCGGAPLFLLGTSATLTPDPGAGVFIFADPVDSDDLRTVIWNCVRWAPS